MSDPKAEPEKAEPQDYDSMTVEELEERFRAGDGIITERDDPEPVEDAPVEEPQPEPEPAVDAAEVEAEAAPAEDPVEEPTEPEPEPPDDAELARQELMLELQKQRAEREKFEMLAGRYTGEVGHLRKQLRELTQTAQPRSREREPAEYLDDERTEPAAPVQPGADPELQSSVAELKEQERARAVNEELQGFLASNNLHGLSQEEVGQLMETLAPRIQEQYKVYSDMDLSIKAQRKVVRLVLDSSYADLQLERVRQARAEAKERKASQVSELKKTKQAAVVSGSGASPAPKPRPKAVEDMTAEEADAALIREYGDGHYRRRRI